MDADPKTAEALTPEVLDAGAPGPDGAGGDDAAAVDEQVTRPTKLIRIASMVRTMLDEVRRAPLDDAGRRRLKEIHEKSLTELQSVLSPELQKELEEVVLPFSSDTPSDAELRLAQAQLVGWLEGLVPRHPGDAVHAADDGAKSARRGPSSSDDRVGPARRARAGPRPRPRPVSRRAATSRSTRTRWSR